MPQISTTGQLENASREMISAARYTEEHNMPAVQLIERFTLEQGSDTLIVPKVGQMVMANLIEGQEISDEQEIGMSTISVTPAEVGAKIVLSDKLLRQNSIGVFTVVGRQMGDGMSRKKDEDAVALYSALNGGTDLGAATRNFNASNATAVISIAKSNKFGSSLRIVMHPNQIFTLNRDLSTVGSGIIRPMPQGFSRERLENFWTGLRIGGVPFFEDGNITRDSGDDGIGAIFDKGAMGMLTSVAMNRERERKAELRGWLLVISADYAMFEIDDSRGAPITMDAADKVTA